MLIIIMVSPANRGGDNLPTNYKYIIVNAIYAIQHHTKLL